MRNDLGPKILKDIFHFVQKPYNLRNDSTLQRQRNCTVYFGTESIWEIVPCDIKNAKSLDIFKEKKLCITDKCLCRLRKRYIGNIGFVKMCSIEIKHNVPILCIMFFLASISHLKLA